jgi:uncharacterized protein (DUF305 family)
VQKRSETGINWRAAALLGLLSSTFSTIASQLLAARLGRDAAVDWTVVAAIPARDPMLQASPAWWAIAIGILFHQWADFSWEVTFFGLFGRPWHIVLLALPWAAFTSAMEWFVLVPLLPFRQPIFTPVQPYWIGLLVHLGSASMYPLFPWIRDRVAGRWSTGNARFAGMWAGLAAAGVAVIGVLAFLGWQGAEFPPWMGADAAADQTYVRRMTAHHRQGVVLALIGAARAGDPHLRALARMMAAEQTGEIAILDQWWQSWFALPEAICGPDERGAMPGMLTDDQVAQLRGAPAAGFDALFVRFMSFHHAGAVQMADAEMRGAGDIRLRIMAQAIRHEQQGEIALMHGARGVPAVRDAVRDLFAARVTPAQFAP